MGRPKKLRRFYGHTRSPPEPTNPHENLTSPPDLPPPEDEDTLPVVVPTCLPADTAHSPFETGAGASPAEPSPCSSKTCGTYSNTSTISNESNSTATARRRLRLERKIQEYMKKTLKVIIRDCSQADEDTTAATESTSMIGRFIAERHLYIAPSPVQGKGLFTRYPIRAGEMLIEYAGEVIGSKIALGRQNFYNFKRIDNYVMQIEKELHIDATFYGNCARFINHSCQPNAAAEILNNRKKKRVLIVALQDIEADTEITYDYHFISDELIPCLCKSDKCRLFLNYNVGRLRLKSEVVEVLLKEQRRE